MKWTDRKTQHAIFADRSAGLTVRQLSEKYGLHINTISRICRRFAQEFPESEYARGLAGCRDRLESKACEAIEAGLDAQADPYRRGNLGAKVLTGLGVFQPDAAQAQINVLINSVPPEWRDRYFVTNSDPGEEAPVITVEAEKGGSQ